MRKQTIISLIATIILFIAALTLIALGIHNTLSPVTYHFGHGFYSYSVRYVSTFGPSWMFSLGRTLLVSSFVMLGFTLYFSTKKDDAKIKEEKASYRTDKNRAEDAEIKEEIKTENNNN